MSQSRCGRLPAWELRGVWRSFQDGLQTISGVVQMVPHSWQVQASGSSLEELGQGGGKTAGWVSSALQECWGISGSDGIEGTEILEK